MKRIPKRIAGVMLLGAALVIGWPGEDPIARAQRMPDPTTIARGSATPGSLMADVAPLDMSDGITAADVEGVIDGWLAEATPLPDPEPRVSPQREEPGATAEKSGSTGRNADAASNLTATPENSTVAETGSDAPLSDTLPWLTGGATSLATLTPAGSGDFADFGVSMGGVLPRDGGNEQPTPEAPSAASAVLAVAPPAAAARSGPTLRLSGESTQLIRVPVDGVVRGEIGAPIDRAELADPAVAEIRMTSPTQFMILGKAAGSTRLLLFLQDEYRAFHILVEPNLLVLDDIIRSMAPTARIKSRSLNGRIILSGRVADTETLERVVQVATAYQGGEVVNHLTVAGNQQTLLKVIVAEVNKEALRRLGINWAIGGSKLSRDFFLANNLGQINPTTFTSGGLPDVRRGQLQFSLLPVANSAATNITFGFPRAELQYFLNALRQNSLARVLAEPNLVAISGQTATFLAGGEVPIPVTQGGATQGAITIEYKEFGVRLAFTPTILGRQQIRIHVMTEVSDAIPDTRQLTNLPVFTFTTRRVESTIECGSGQTFAIGGLLNERVNAIASKIPGLGDIPVLGTLFSSVEYQTSKTELVILVTPQLVEPMDPDQVIPPPSALITHPTDIELFTLQQLEGAPNPDDGTHWTPPGLLPSDIHPHGADGDNQEALLMNAPTGLEESEAEWIEPVSGN